MDDNEKNLIKGIYVRKPKEDVEEESRRSLIQDIISSKGKGPRKSAINVPLYSTKLLNEVDNSDREE